MTPLDFLTTLQYNFSIRHENDEHMEKWVSMMVRELNPYSGDILQRACDEISRTRKDKRFPMLAECLTACREAKRWLDGARPELKAQATMAARPAYERFRDTAESLIHGPMGRQAAHEGWIGLLYTFISKNGRLPDAGEKADLIREMREFDDAYAECVRGGWPQAKILAELGGKMLNRRSELSAKVLKPTFTVIDGAR